MVCQRSLYFSDALTNGIPATDNVDAAPYTPTNGSMVGNSAYILASFHNTLNSLLPLNPGAFVATANGGPIVAGQSNQLLLSSENPNVALDGMLLYAKTATAVRVGSFTDKGGMGTFADFPGCGLNQEGQFAGVIQQMVISCNVSSYVSQLGVLRLYSHGTDWATEHLQPTLLQCPSLRAWQQPHHRWLVGNGRWLWRLEL